MQWLLYIYFSIAFAVVADRRVQSRRQSNQLRASCRSAMPLQCIPWLPVRPLSRVELHCTAGAVRSGNASETKQKQTRRVLCYAYAYAMVLYVQASNQGVSCVCVAGPAQGRIIISTSTSRERTRPLPLAKICFRFEMMTILYYIDEI